MPAGATWVLRGHVGLRVKRQLAEGKLTHQEIAEELELDRSTISFFAKKHRAEIEEIRADIENEFAGLWVAKKAARIAEYTEVIEKIDVLLEMDPSANDRSALLGRKQQALKSIAEELGQLTARHEVSAKVNYKVNGVSAEDLT